MHTSVEQRLVRLERANRILTALLIVGIASLGSLALTQEPIAEEFRAQRFVLVDPSTEQELAVLGFDATQGTFLRLTHGIGMLKLSINGYGPSVVGNEEDLFNPVAKVRPLR